MDDGTMTPNDSVLVPVRQQQVDFYGDQLAAGQLADGTVLVPLKPICEAIGVDWSSQRQRLTRDEVLAGAVRSMVITTIEGHRREALALPLDLLPGWLFGISARRVRPDLAEKITRYRRECFRVLWDAFKGDILPTVPAPVTGLSGAELAVEIAGAVYALAQQQLAIERALADEQQARQDLATRHQVMADYMRGFVEHTRLHQQQTDTRLSALEVRLDPKQVLTEEQAAELALAVKNVGKALERQGDRQGYAKVYSELYRRYRISSYKNLPQQKLPEVLDWLHGWSQELANGQDPVA